MTKKFEQQKNINYARTFSFVAKSCSIRILFTSAIYYGLFIKYFNEVKAYFNFDDDILLYVKLLDRYKQPKKATLLRKIIYSLNQYFCQCHKNLSAKPFKASFT